MISVQCMYYENIKIIVTHVTKSCFGLVFQKEIFKNILNYINWGDGACMPQNASGSQRTRCENQFSPSNV